MNSKKKVLDWIIIMELVIILMIAFALFPGCGGGGGGGNGGAASGSTPSNYKGNLNGQVTRTTDGIGQNEAIIAAELYSPPSTQSALTTVSGYYEFQEITAGIWTISTAKTGYQTCKKNAQILSSQTSTCNIKMPPNASGIVLPPVFDSHNPPTNPNPNPKSAKAGEEIVIKGNGFGANEGVVNFGDIQADVVPSSWSDTSITVKVPIGITAGNTNISVIRYNDGQKSSDLLFTIIL